MAQIINDLQNISSSLQLNFKRLHISTYCQSMKRIQHKAGPRFGHRQFHSTLQRGSDYHHSRKLFRWPEKVRVTRSVARDGKVPSSPTE